MAGNGAIRASLIITATILLIAAVYFASSIFAPLTFALLVLALVWPLQKSLQERLPRSAALFITLLVTVVAVLVFASMLAWALSGIAEWLLNNVQRFQTLYKQATDWLEEHGIFVAGTLSERFDVIWLIRMFQEVARRLNRLAGFAILAFVFLMMLLLEVEQFARKLGSIGKGVGAKFVEAFGESADKFRRYMLVRTLLSLVTGLAVWGFAALMGVEPAFAWGLLAFALNYIPFVGSFVATLTARTVRPGPARFMAGDHARHSGPGLHPVRTRQLCRAAGCRRGAFHLALCGRLRGVLLGLFVGHSRSLYRRSDHDCDHHHLREISVAAAGSQRCYRASRPAGRRRRTEAFIRSILCNRAFRKIGYGA